MKQFLEQCAVWFQDGKYATVVTECEAKLQSPLTPQRKADLLYHLGRALAVGFPARRGEALTFFRESAILARRQPRLQASVLVNLCGTLAYLGDPDSVRPYLDQLKTLAQRHPGLDLNVHLGSAWYNYALALECPEQWREAESAYLAAIASFEASPQPQAREFVLNSWHNLSLVYIHLGQLPKAREAMERSHPHLPPARRAKVLNRQAEYHLAAGDPSFARRQVREALHAAGTDEECLAEVHLTWARIEASVRQVDLARELAGIALELAKKLRHARLQHQICRVLQNLMDRGVGT